jgi:phosphodiesterase/alkaline phosphatase D-like protein
MISRFSQYLTDPNILRLRAAGPAVGEIVDDHEVANDAYAIGADNHGDGLPNDIEEGIDYATRKVI